MEETTNLKLPLLVPNQSQKEITHNEALIIIDNILQNGIIDKDLTTPPENPNTNDMYIVGEGAIGKWEGKDNYLAFYDNGWKFIEPREGFNFWVNDEDKIYIYNGSKWIATIQVGADIENNNSTTPTTPSITKLSELEDVEIIEATQYNILQHNGEKFINTSNLQQLSMVGINTQADENNKLSIKSDYVLFDNNGNSSKIKVNKATETDTASHLFQSNYSGRAEFGLVGDDDFTLKVSSDGTNWNNSFVVDKATGNIDFKANITQNGTNIIGVDFITERYLSSNGLSWYIKYNSGWIEQGGMIGGSYSNNGSIIFLVPFIDTKYIINLCNYSIEEGAIANKRNVCINAYSRTGIGFASNPYIICWEAKGFYK